MNVLVVGNGFDLAHGLPTRYGDFLDFTFAFKMYRNNKGWFDNGNEQQKEKNRVWLSYFTKKCEVSDGLGDEIGRLIDKNSWVEYFENLWFYDRYSLNGFGWIDFEHEISEMIQHIDEVYTISKECEKQGRKQGDTLTALEQKIMHRINKIARYTGSPFYSLPSIKEIGYLKSHLLRDLNGLVRLLEIYLSDFVTYENSNHLDIVKQLRIDRLLSFNYTDTYKNIYANSTDLEIEYCFIHGKAQLNGSLAECNLVLGIDEYLQEKERDDNNEFVEFKKFYQRIYKMTESYYIDWINSWQESTSGIFKNLNPPELNIYFYGHSLDITDRDVLRKLILTEGAKTTIFYHSKEALGSQIVNLVKVIGEEELINRTRGLKRTIEFKPTY